VSTSSSILYQSSSNSHCRHNTAKEKEEQWHNKVVIRLLLSCPPKIAPLSLKESYLLPNKLDGILGDKESVYSPE